MKLLGYGDGNGNGDANKEEAEQLRGVPIPFRIAIGLILFTCGLDEKEDRQHEEHCGTNHIGDDHGGLECECHLFVYLFVYVWCLS